MIIENFSHGGTSPSSRQLQKLSGVFDYLVVGGGTAGCVAAAELHRYEAGTIAMIESGSYPVGRIIHTPALYSQAFGGRWDYELVTEPQSAMRGRRIRWPRGKMLGGSSGLNAMIYNRGSSRDFESWPENWQYDCLVPSFQAIEERLFGEDQLPSLPNIHPLSERFLQATQQAGFACNNNGGMEAKIGVQRYLRTQRNGRRLNAYAAFVKSRPIEIVSNATVDKILFANQAAIGVEVRRGSQTDVLRARKAVIVASGTVHSPLLLQRSGIGPAALLKRAGIESIIDNEHVGTNLQDHLIFPLIYQAHHIDSMTSLYDRDARIEYATRRTGPFVSNIAEVGGFGTFKDDRTPGAKPEFQWHFTPAHYLEYPTRSDPTKAWTIGVTLLHPKSRGRIELKSKDDANPMIDPDYLSNDDDLERTMVAVQYSMKLAEQPALADCQRGNILPGNKRLSGVGLENAIRAYATTIFHPIGTCRIGSIGDSVVDSRLKVYGTSNLYVADASVIPTLPSANPQAIVMMIGARVAEFLANT